MKKIYLFTALALGTLFNTTAQVVFNSSIESWSAGLPTDMYGSKSNIGAAGVTQVTGSSSYGMNSARLTNATATHKRFTTLPMTVNNTKNYQIKFWVKGQGDIRTGMFDGRSTGFGYATYNSYITINSSVWTMYTQNVLCANDTVAGELIFSVVNTVAPDHIMLDSVIITETVFVPTTLSIYDIQYTTAGPGYASPYNSQIVNTGGIVSAIYTGGYFLQSGSGQWRGIEVDDAVNMPAIGDSVTVTASVEENFNNTRLTAVSTFTIVSSGNPVPSPAIITTTEGNTENYEGVFSRSTSVCVDPNIGFGMWTQYTAPDTLKVDDLIYHFTPTLGLNYQVTGVISYSYSEFKINPRMASDVVLITGVNELNALDAVSAFPNPSSTYVKLNNLPPTAKITLFDITGKSVLNTTSNTIPTLDLENGTYIISIITNDSIKSLKLLVKH